MGYVEELEAKYGKADPTVEDPTVGASPGLRAAASFKEGDDKAAFLEQKLGKGNVFKGTNNGTVFYKVKEDGQWKHLDPETSFMDTLKSLSFLGPKGDIAGDIADLAGPAVDAAKNEAKDAIARAPARLMALLGGPMVEAPVGAVVRGTGALGDEKKPALEALQEGQKQGAIETVTNLAAEAVPFARIPVGTALARMSESKVLGGLTKTLRSVVERGGSAEAQRVVAGTVMDKALADGGAELLPAKKIAEYAGNINFSVLVPEEKALLRDIEKTVTDGTMTLNDADRMIRVLGKKAAASTDKEKARLLWDARGALLGDIKGAGGEGLSQAADLATGREAYGRALGRIERSQAREDLMVGAEARRGQGRLDRSVDAGKLADATGGPNRQDVAAMFKGDPVGRRQFETLADAAGVFAKGQSGLVKKYLPDPAQRLLSSNSMLAAASKDPVASNMLRMAIDPKFSNKPEIVAVLLGKVTDRLSAEYMKKEPKATVPIGDQPLAGN